MSLQDDPAGDDAPGEQGRGVRLAVDTVTLPEPSELELEEARLRSSRSGLEMVDLRQLDIDPSAAPALPGTIARRHRAAAIGRRFGLPLIAIAAPENLLAIDDIYLAAGTDVLLVVAPERQVEACVEALYPAGDRSLDAGPTGHGAAPAPTDEHGEPPAEAHYGVDDVDWYRIGTFVGDGVRSDPVLPLVEPFEEPPFPSFGEEPVAEAAAEAAVEPAAELPVEPAAEPADEAAASLGDPGAAMDGYEGVDGGLVFGPTLDEVLSDLAGSVEAAEPAEPARLDEPLGAVPGGEWPFGDHLAGEQADGLDRSGERFDQAGADEPVVPWWMQASGAHGDALDAPGELTAELGWPPAEPPADPVAAASAWRQRDVGDILLADGLVAEDQLATARQNSRTTGRPLRAVLSELKLVGEADLLRAVATEADRRLIDLDQWPIDPRAGALLPESVARRYRVLAIGFEDGRPVVATADPSDVVALDDVRTLLGGQIVVVVCAAQQIDVYLGRVYRRTEETDLAARHAALVVTGPETARMADLEDLHSVVDEAPVVKFVNLVLRQALNENASDVHIEPTARDLVVRCRIDGVLHHLTSAPKAIQGSVTTRLKVMAGLDIAEHRVPQDGRFSLGVGDRQVDLRLATLPTVHGEKIVLRILDKSTAPLQLERLGFLPGVLDRYHRAYRRPAGTILVTGPTGSGKSTTLYATLAELNSPERNLITVEDPVEYQLPGVNQVQVNPRAGLTFASALRSILRSDPDIILVGEIRDKETATIAVEAALTGHLVLSCLHTNDAVSTPMRLIEMGVEPFLVGSAIDCILAQRLARILCQRCAQPYEPNAEELRSAGWDDAVLDEGEAPAFRRANGCQACSGTGYRGRIAVQEVLLVDEDVERAILDRAPSEEISRLAKAQGMTVLRRDGLHKAALGITSLEEIMRVIV